MCFHIAKNHLRHRMTQMQGYVLHMHILKTQSKTLLQLQSSNNMIPRDFPSLDIPSTSHRVCCDLLFFQPLFWKHWVRETSISAINASLWGQLLPAELYDRWATPAKPTQEGHNSKEDGRHARLCWMQGWSRQMFRHNQRKNKVSKFRQLGKIKI